MPQILVLNGKMNLKVDIDALALVMNEQMSKQALHDKMNLKVDGHYLEEQMRALHDKLNLKVNSHAFEAQIQLLLKASIGFVGKQVNMLNDHKC